MLNLIKQHQSDLLALCRKYDVRRLDLFGSSLRPDFQPGRSDLDFAVEFNNLSVQDAADRFLGLLVDLEDLFALQIDLVSYPAIKNPHFRRNLDATRVTLYAA